jgi:hypothetical protein
MDQQAIESFPAEVAGQLKTYVYRLIDPRNGETFYIGKGQGNRVFSHIRAEQDLEGDDLDNKIKRIREIRLAGCEVAHVIHRHGMDEKTALEVEAALIDAYWILGVDRDRSRTGGLALRVSQPSYRPAGQGLPPLAPCKSSVSRRLNPELQHLPSLPSIYQRA